MMKPIALVLFAFLFLGCSRPSLTGTYRTVGSEDKFQMTLEVREDGKAAFSTRSNLGSPELDQKVQATIALRDAHWTRDGANLLVAGTQGDGKPMTYRFVVQPNGELLWDRNGARFVKGK